MSERLAMFTAAVEKHGRPFATAYQNLIAQLKNAAAGVTAPGKGDTLPPFLLPTTPAISAIWIRCWPMGPWS